MIFMGVHQLVNPHPCVPSMDVDWRVKVPCGGWLHQPLAKGKGIVAKRCLKEAVGKTAT
jgi:hypothetical protein